MAKTMLAISLLAGAGACTSAPASQRVAPTTTGPTSTTAPATTTTEAATTTTEPEPTTTTTEAVQEVEETPTTVPTTRARSAPTTAPYVAPVPSSGSAPLACIRSYEGGYTTDTGNGYYGAYQFDMQTWRSVGGTGNPAHASPAEQDMRAQMLYDRRGLQPWPTPAVMCG